MAIKAIQQFQLRTVIGTEAKAKETLRLMEEAGYDGIELCSYMIKHMSLTIRAITRLAGMPMGKSGNLDWHALLADTNLKVVSIHQDLGTLKRVPEEAIAEAKSYGTKYIVITGMHHFDYSDKEAVDGLIADLNACGKRLKADGITITTVSFVRLMVRRLMIASLKTRIRNTLILSLTLTGRQRQVLIP